MHSKKVPIGATIKYGSFVMGEGKIIYFYACYSENNTSEFDQLLETFTAMQMEINGYKKRTARGVYLFLSKGNNKCFKNMQAML